MKVKEILGKTVPELYEMRRSLEKKRLDLRFQSALKGNQAKPNQHNVVRKDIARIHTVLREKQRNKDLDEVNKHG